MQGRLLGFLLAAVLASPAAAEGLTDWNVSPPELDLGDWAASLGGTADGTGFLSSGAARDTGASLSAVLFPHLERTLDNGWDIGAKGAILATHDRLAGDIYGDRTFEKGYLFVQTPYGLFEAGEDDGAAYRLSVTGPSVDPDVAVDNAATTFFRDPTTGRAFIDVFRLNAAVFATTNDAKFTYVSPTLYGLRVSGSYTPYISHGGLPFVSQGPDVADRQTNLLEGAAHYAGDVGDVSYALYAGAALGHDAARTPDHADLHDWGFGAEADDSFDGIKFSLGGAYRQSNAYAFDVFDARAASETRSWRLSTTATLGPWIAGFEYAGGKADNAVTSPALGETGFEASLGYVINSNLQLTAGWQGLAFRRDQGAFFNGTPSVYLDAEFLHLKFHV